MIHQIIFFKGVSSVFQHYNLGVGKKSSLFSERNPTKSLRLPGNGKQYNHMKDDVLCYLKNRIERKDVVESSVLQSFANGDYYYIYFTIHEDVESFHQDSSNRP